MCRVGGRHYRPGACFKLRGVKKKKKKREYVYMSSGPWRFERFFLPHFFTEQIDGLDQVKDVNYFYIGISHQQRPVSTTVETWWVVGSLLSFSH